MQTMTYESAMAKLKEMTERLESGALSLDESLETYAKGVELVKLCNQKLQSAQKQMTVLLEDLEGNIQEVPFQEEDYRG